MDVKREYIFHPHRSGYIGIYPKLLIFLIITRLFHPIIPEKIKFMDQESEFVVKEGQDATLLCEVDGDPVPQVQWLFKDVEVNFGRFFLVTNCLLCMHFLCHWDNTYILFVSSLEYCR